ncbi:hypothetical protein SAMN06265220_103231 [Flavobacterium nitrogenifigens]|uniref:Uncharacterized protein n=1 Tax=Flavobacterium nitrogenifigens TaxID=1617283 RepID=A0A521DQJ9_9FLAO|nr:hypothetical protein SAMN06265220_103231 [Flavobacterium nitrogenifigens]
MRKQNQTFPAVSTAGNVSDMHCVPVVETTGYV